MKIKNVNNISNPQLKVSKDNQKASNTQLQQDDKKAKARILVRIPKDYREEPIISRLISQHGLIVNIAAAILGANGRDDGWFDLEISGTTKQISSAQIYLNDLDLEVLSEPKYQEYSW